MLVYLNTGWSLASIEAPVISDRFSDSSFQNQLLQMHAWQLLEGEISQLNFPRIASHGSILRYCL